MRFLRLFSTVTTDPDGLWTIKGKICHEFADDGDGENYVFIKKVYKDYTYTSKETVNRIFISSGYGYYPSNLKLHDVKYINGNISFSEFKNYVVEAFKDCYSDTTIERDLNVFINAKENERKEKLLIYENYQDKFIKWRLKDNKSPSSKEDVNSSYKYIEQVEKDIKEIKRIKDEKIKEKKHLISGEIIGITNSAEFATFLNQEKVEEKRQLAEELKKHDGGF